MLFYHPDCDLHFENYGIEIPIVEERAHRVFLELKNINPTLEYFPLKELPSISKDDLLRVHTSSYVDKLFSSLEELNQAMITCYELVDQDGNYNRYDPANAHFPFTHAREQILKQVALFYVASKSALKNGFSFFLGGGMHHAMSFTGRGFCLVNDIVIVLRKLQSEKLITHAWVIDLDAHKGDGTAQVTQNDPTISTFSIHMKDGWPLNQGEASDPWFIASDVDVGIAKNEEDSYIEKLSQGLALMESKFPHPDLVIIVDGADPYIEDELPSSELLQLSKEQMLKRDQIVYEFFKKRNIPMSYCMAGGYGKKSWEIYFQFLYFVWQNSPERTKISSR